jgi:hypothetical protein
VPEEEAEVEFTQSSGGFTRFDGLSMDFSSRASATALAIDGAPYAAQALVFDGAEEIVANGSVSGVTLERLTPDAPPAKVVVAVYEAGGRLKTLGAVDVDESTNLDEPLECSVPFGANVLGVSVKVFVWDSFENMAPLAGVYRYNAESGASIELNAVEGQISTLALTTRGISSFAGQTFTIAFNPDVLELADVSSVFGALTITDADDGVFSFTVDKPPQSGRAFSGVFDAVVFNGLQTATTSVSLTVGG